MNFQTWLAFHEKKQYMKRYLLFLLFILITLVIVKELQVQETVFISCVPCINNSFSDDEQSHSAVPVEPFILVYIIASVIGTAQNSEVFPNIWFLFIAVQIPFALKNDKFFPDIL